MPRLVSLVLGLAFVSACDPVKAADRDGAPGSADGGDADAQVACSAEKACPGSQKCLDGTCVECIANADCTSVAAPVCDLGAHTCGPCTASAQCASEACDTKSGQCVDEPAIVYAAPVGSTDYSCGARQSPCQDLDKAVGRIGAGRTHLRLLPGEYDQRLVIDNISVVVVADGATIRTNDTAGEAVTVFNNADVRISGLTINGTPKPGVGCDKAALSLTQVRIVRAAGDGIFAQNCNLTVEDSEVSDCVFGINAGTGTLDLRASRIAHNQNGGVQFGNSSTKIRDSLFINNSNSAQYFGAVRGSGGGTPGQEVLIAYNTFVQNQVNSAYIGIVNCADIPGAVVANNIFHKNLVNGLVDKDQTVMYCQTSGVVAGNVSDANLGAGNTFVATPGFVDYANLDLHLVAGSPAIDQGSVQYSSGRDFDGKPRLAGAAPDCGAYERQ